MKMPKREITKMEVPKKEITKREVSKVCTRGL